MFLEETCWESVWYIKFEQSILEYLIRNEVRQASVWQWSLLLDQRHNYIQIISKTFEILKSNCPECFHCINFPCIFILTAMRKDLYETCGSQFGYVPRCTSLSYSHHLRSCSVQPNLKKKKKKKEKRENQHRQCIVSRLFLSAGR